MIFTCSQATLKGFRSGKFMTLVATNVAARGLDIDDVQLIIQVFYCIHIPCLILELYWYLSVDCDDISVCKVRSH